jgi:hypothetical protein
VKRLKKYLGLREKNADQDRAGHRAGQRGVCPGPGAKGLGPRFVYVQL